MQEESVNKGYKM